MRYKVLGAAMALLIGAPVASAQQQMQVDVIAEWDEGFGYLSAVRELSDGRVLVADPLGMMLVAIDMDAGSMESWGREGGGPREWRQPDSVHPLPGGKSLLVDLGNNRLTILGPDGTFEDTTPIARGGNFGGGGRPTPPTMLIPRDVDAEGNIYFAQRSFGNPNDSVTVTRAGYAEDSEMVSLGKAKPQDMRQQTSGGAGNQNVSITPIPMSPQDDWAVAQDGTVVYVRSDDYRLEIQTPDGRTIRGPVIDAEALRPTDDDKYAYLEGTSTGGIQMGISIQNGDPTISLSRGGGGGNQDPDLRQYEWPDRMPIVRQGTTEVSPDGRIFVGRTVRVGENSLYDVFDMQGRRTAQVEFSPNSRIVGFGEGGVVYLARTDEFGLMWLQKVRVG